ncbi:hypothetical protein BJV78DRAFT_1158137 [Lactifluus subvellereus]|nr:hypothetical protein BJV78DRAFT_1158137 [Lactifluus subvellereus]
MSQEDVALLDVTMGGPDIMEMTVSGGLGGATYLHVGDVVLPKIVGQLEAGETRRVTSVLCQKQVESWCGAKFESWHGRVNKMARSLRRHPATPCFVGERGEVVQLAWSTQKTGRNYSNPCNEKDPIEATSNACHTTPLLLVYKDSACEGSALGD